MTPRRTGRSALLIALGVLAALETSPVVARADAQQTTLFSEGNDHYAAGQFDEAVKDYRQILSQGFEAAAVHYNLGNALYKSGKVGPAILEMEKAAVLAPNDPDIVANLGYLRSLTADKATTGAQTTSFFVERLLAMTTLDQDCQVLALLYLVVGALVSVRIVAGGHLMRRAALWGIAALAVPLALSAGVCGIKTYRAATTTHAVVLQERLDVRSGPGDENTTLFTVHEGLKLRVHKQQGSWLQVSLDSGLTGWVPVSSVGVI